MGTCDTSRDAGRARHGLSWPDVNNRAVKRGQAYTERGTDSAGTDCSLQSGQAEDPFRCRPSSRGLCDASAIMAHRRRSERRCRPSGHSLVGENPRRSVWCPDSTVMEGPDPMPTGRCFSDVTPLQRGDGPSATTRGHGFGRLTRTAGSCTSGRQPAWTVGIVDGLSVRPTLSGSSESGRRANIYGQLVPTRRLFRYQAASWSTQSCPISSHQLLMISSCLGVQRSARRHRACWALSRTRMRVPRPMGPRVAAAL